MDAEFFVGQPPKVETGNRVFLEPRSVRTSRTSYIIEAETAFFKRLLRIHPRFSGDPSIFPTVPRHAVHAGTRGNPTGSLPEFRSTQY